MIVTDKQLSAVVPLFTQNDGISLLAWKIKIMLIQGDSLLLFAGKSPPTLPLARAATPTLTPTADYDVCNSNKLVSDIEAQHAADIEAAEQQRATLLTEVQPSTSDRQSYNLTLSALKTKPA